MPNSDEARIRQRLSQLAAAKPSAEATSVAMARVRQKLMRTNTRPTARSASVWRTVMRNNLTKLAVAAAILAVLGVLVGRMGPIGKGNIVWADVAERFQSVPLFSASIYRRENATSEPMEIELWWKHDGHTRLRIKTQVVFGLNGQVTGAFDVQTRQPVEPDRSAVQFLAMIAQAKEFSLNAIIDTIFGGKAKDVTPQVNLTRRSRRTWSCSTSICLDRLNGFASGPCQSRLPVRFRVWDPRDGAATNVIFEYSTGQPEAFFDPNAFARLLGEHGW